MSNLVETITVKVTLHRDKADHFPYDHLWDTLRRMWLHVCPWNHASGYVNLHNIEISWKSSGLHEVPETTAGDN